MLALLFILQILQFPNLILADYSTTFNADDAFTMIPKESPEITIIEQEFLSLLGLRNRPKLDLEKYRHNSAPHFLRQIYNSLDTITVENAKDLLQGEIDSEKMLDAISKADFIISFINQGIQMEKAYNSLSDPSAKAHMSHEFLYFDISRIASEVKVEQKAILAEVRVYKEISPLFPTSGDHFTVTLYKVVPIGDELLGLEIVAKKAVHPYFFGWVAFDVTEVVTEWQKNSFLNFGLQLVVRDFNETVEYSLSAVGISGNHADDFKQPFLAAFYPSFDESRSRELMHRRRRSVNPSYQTTMMNSDPYHRAKSRCQRKTFLVSFAELGWEDWILAPESYHAYHCTGLCQFPLDAALNATNHAILQTIMHVFDPDEVEPACCAPKKLSPIQVLYFDDDSNVILKRYREMVVEYCGCQ